jgi:UDP-GlcNAc3NAcA epimerase
MKKILTVVGARPQFVKAAALSRALKLHGKFREVLVHTGQHYDASMSEVFFNEMEIPDPDYNLDVSNLTHGAMTGRMLEKVEEVLIAEKPSCVILYGDTNSTLAGALAAAKLYLPVAHVEAGLRSGNMHMPEEINRIVTDRLSSLLFCPTEDAVRNLEKEGFGNFPCRILRSGDVMQDAALYYAEKSAAKSTILRDNRLDEFILCTLHRAENTDDPDRLRSIVDALNRIHRQHRVFLPLHPRTRRLLEQSGIRPEFELHQPVGYFDMLELLRQCRLVITDSGGLQKEAYFFKKHCVTLREETEWNELVRHGVNILAGADTEHILEAARRMLLMESDFSMDFYGNGQACQRIVQELDSYLSGNTVHGG